MRGDRGISSLKTVWLRKAKRTSLLVSALPEPEIKMTEQDLTKRSSNNSTLLKLSFRLASREPRTGRKRTSRAKPKVSINVSTKSTRCTRPQVGQIKRQKTLNDSLRLCRNSKRSKTFLGASQTRPNSITSKEVCAHRKSPRELNR